MSLGLKSLAQGAQRRGSDGPAAQFLLPQCHKGGGVRGKKLAGARGASASKADQAGMSNYEIKLTLNPEVPGATGTAATVSKREPLYAVRRKPRWPETKWANGQWATITFFQEQNTWRKKDSPTRANWAKDVLSKKDSEQLGGRGRTKPVNRSAPERIPQTQKSPTRVPQENSQPAKSNPRDARTGTSTGYKKGNRLKPERNKSSQKTRPANEGGSATKSTQSDGQGKRTLEA